MPREIAIDYQQYLASREWRAKRKEFIETATYGVCQRCGTGPIKNVHHLTYANLGNEKLRDLMGLCRPCHEYLAAERDDDPAIEIIKHFIVEHGLFPAKVWPGQDSWPWAPFVSGYPDREPCLNMTLVSESEYADFMPNQPRMLVGPGVMAIFYWL